jgi:hypothetical protein
MILTMHNRLTRWLGTLCFLGSTSLPAQGGSIPISLDRLQESQVIQIGAVATPPGANADVAKRLSQALKLDILQGFCTETKKCEAPVAGFLSSALLFRKPISENCPFPEESFDPFYGKKQNSGSYVFRTDQYDSLIETSAVHPIVSKTMSFKLTPSDGLSHVLSSQDLSCFFNEKSACQAHANADLKLAPIDHSKADVYPQTHVSKDHYFLLDCQRNKKCMVAKLSLIEGRFSDVEIKKHPERKVDQPLVGMFDLFSIVPLRGRPPMATHIASRPLQGRVQNTVYFLQSNFAVTKSFGTVPLDVVLTLKPKTPSQWAGSLILIRNEDGSSGDPRFSVQVESLAFDVLRNKIKEEL